MAFDSSVFDEVIFQSAEVNFILEFVDILEVNIIAEIDNIFINIKFEESGLYFLHDAVFIEFSVKNIFKSSNIDLNFFGFNFFILMDFEEFFVFII